MNFHGDNHIVLICDTTNNLYLFLEIRNNDLDKMIVIISNQIKSLPGKDFPYSNTVLLTTLNFDLEIFERAITRSADSIFIMGSKGLYKCDTKDKVNEFLIFKINRYYVQLPIYVQTLYSEKSISNTKLIVNYKKIIPIMRIKSLLNSKALFNPGFVAFMQNLLFYKVQVNTSEIYTYDSAMQSYILGCENKIVIRQLRDVFL